jgi:hypothetical protein
VILKRLSVLEQKCSKISVHSAMDDVKKATNGEHDLELKRPTVPLQRKQQLPNRDQKITPKSGNLTSHLS